MIFLDSPSTTPLDQTVFEAMLPYMQPGSANAREFGQSERSGNGLASRAARESVADLIDCFPNEIVWTSGATEANNLAILGFAALKGSPGRVVSQATEHSSVLEPLKHLERLGWEIELLPVNQWGAISLDALRDSLADDTDMVSIMWGNNEIGTIQPIMEIADMCAEREVVFHCDAAQAVGKVPMDLSKLPLTMLTLSAHKFYGPVGAGTLFVRDLAKRKTISPLMFGGGQEHGLRPGTLNVPAIVGLGAACRLARQRMGEWTEHAASLRTRFESILLSGLTNVSINGDVDNRLPHISNIAFHGTDNEGLLTMLPNIVASTGSACHYADFNPSHVLQSLGKSPDVTDCSLRFGFSNVNTMDEAAEAAHMIVKAVMEFSANA